MTLEEAAGRALTATREVLAGDEPFARADLALTLHMLEFVAPRFFEKHDLRTARDAALAALYEVPSGFEPGLDGDEAMARIDALYLREVRGLPVRPFDRAELERYIRSAAPTEGRLWAWLMGELAARIGVDAAMATGGHWVFRQERVLHLYHLTHVVLLATEYLRKPVPPRLDRELDELERWMPRLIQEGRWDLLGECVLCLNHARRPAKAAVDALIQAQRDDGGFAEAHSTPRMAAHCTAVGVLALAGALDLERSAP